MTKQEALEVVIKECPDEYAKTYAIASRGMSGEMLDVQVLYVLTNTQYWRGEVARKTKEVLRSLV